MKRHITFAIATTTLTVLLAMATTGGAQPAVTFMAPTPLNEAVIMEASSVEVQAQIVEPALADVTFNWNGTTYPIYDDSLILMFNFDSMPLADLSTYGHEVTGGTVDAADIAAYSAQSYYGNYLDLATDEYVEVADSTELKTNVFTIACWFRADNPSSGTQTLVARGEDAGDKAQWVVELNDSANPGTVELWYEESSDADHYFPAGTTILPDTWYHFAASRDSSGTVKVYLDGVKKGEWTGHADPAIIDVPVTIGARSDSASMYEYFDGGIDEVRIWNRALSEAEVQQQYMTNLT